MNLALILSETDWQVITAINKQTILRANTDSAIRSILESCGEISDTCGCYAWSTRSAVYQCVCFGSDYKQLGFPSNLAGTLHFTFGTENNPVSQCASTSELLFQRMNKVLEEEDLYLSTLRVDMLQFGKTYLNHANFTEDPLLANAITGFLVYYYRQRGQCAWH